MYWPLFQTLLILSAGACACLWHLRPVRPVFGLAGAGGWALVALQARNIEHYSGGQAFTAGSSAFQYLAMGMAVLSVLTVVLWQLGVFPPDANSEIATGDRPGQQTDIGD
jgi:hypothetical protein